MSTIKPINTYQSLKIHSPLAESSELYLRQLKALLDKSTEETTRTIAFRFDLRFPVGYKGDDTKVITKFFESLKAIIKAKENKTLRQGGRVYPNRLKYAWVRENGGAEKDHFHVVIILNKDAFYALGNFKSTKANLAKRIKKAWCSALLCKTDNSGGLVHYAKKGVYILDKNSLSFNSIYGDLYYRISYFAKKRTKVYGTGVRSFGCSR
ncbi:hypothetical protein MUS1_09585 [Marinomonas ushuaiensis DSM 15871]|uniref:YagK/YfjJ C-terminal domain-containing protein n=1 Tax=Marinomonas ushuaiensis DSM 15871 TaxID=1122207 RepID=X7E634_9GAMM|nr:inovirus Gp2 family protein [Marinomonas ushuaiensis]ETX11519.1 hypothetical protein MUS1_09585 [Marinomonas ushuaiensis DSM 15871]